LSQSNPLVVHRLNELEHYEEIAAMQRDSETRQEFRLDRELPKVLTAFATAQSGLGKALIGHGKLESCVDEDFGDWRFEFASVE
jgi:hypothetical protein